MRNFKEKLFLMAFHNNNNSVIILRYNEDETGMDSKRNIEIKHVFMYEIQQILPPPTCACFKFEIYDIL